MTKNTVHTPENLRALADFLAEHPSLPEPTLRSYPQGCVDFFVHSTKEMQAVISSIGGMWDKNAPGAPGEYGWDYYQLTNRQKVGGYEITITSLRNETCERKVVATETVTIPSQPAIPARTFDKEIVEWECKPLHEKDPVSA